MLNKFKVIFILTLIMLAFQNFDTPDFPARNIDTVVLKKIDGQYKTTTPHVPITDFSLDGRIAIRRKGVGTAAPLFALRPENVVSHLRDSRNPLVGANLIGEYESPQYVFHPGRVFRNSEALHADHDQLYPIRTIMCEKTEISQNPYVCDQNKDCYNLTLITFFHNKVAGDERRLKLASVDIKVSVSNPKTSSASIDGVDINHSSIRVSPLHAYPKLAEPVIVGDNRLLITRVHKAQVTLSDGSLSDDDINIVYSTYSENYEQCDVTRWSGFHPISHAHHDTVNRMQERYKFARYPLRDSMGTVVPDGKEFGGSYPWMDKDAANLFFTAFGRDHFYSFVNDEVRIPFAERDKSRDYFTPKLRIIRSRFDSDVNYVEARNERTVGVSMAGFWTHGKTVVFDGQLNSADYAFRVSDRCRVSLDDGRCEHEADRIKVHRELSLYNRTPAGQSLEKVGAMRERGTEVLHGEFHPHLELNSTFLGSIENRLNYLKTMKPATARDVVWHFNSTRHSEEIIFDDYMSPFMLINAEMTQPAGFLPTKNFMRSYDGFLGGRESHAANIDTHPRSFPPHKAPALIQNAATSPESFIKVPYYGRLKNGARVEPIAKGGIYGKGLWLSGTSSAEFAVPDQDDTDFNLGDNQKWYVGVFVDPRGSHRVDESRRLISWSNRSIELAKQNEGNFLYDTVVFKENNTTVASLTLPSGLEFKSKRWKHIGFRFHERWYPGIYINGYPVRGIIKSDESHEVLVKTFFNIEGEERIERGGAGSSTQGVKGWLDEFKVIARFPRHEEACNYARGTLIQIPEGNDWWRTTADRYPGSAHQHIRRSIGEDDTSKRYACFVSYHGGQSVGTKLASEKHTHLKNIPNNAKSIREKQLAIKGKLIFNKPRVDYTDNQFCLSCHIDNRFNSNRELNMDALTRNSNLNLQSDPRRTPMQPPQFIRGVIPAHYFGPDKPSRTLASQQAHFIDQWINPEIESLSIKWNSLGPDHIYSLDIQRGQRVHKDCLSTFRLQSSTQKVFDGRCLSKGWGKLTLDQNLKVRICSFLRSGESLHHTGCSRFKSITDHDNSTLELYIAQQ